MYSFFAMYYCDRRKGKTKELFFMVGCIKKRWDDKWKCLRFERGNAISLGCNWFARGENCKPSPDKKCRAI